MVITLFILGYIASVFLCRWANKMVYQKIKHSPKMWLWWYIPIVNIWILLPIVLEILDHHNFFDNKFLKWFRGDNW